MTQASYFMRIENPSDIRRQILENSKSVIETMRRFEKIKELRAEKYNSIIKLKHIMSELFEIMSRLRSALPQPKTSPIIKGKLVRKAKAIAARPAASGAQRPKSDLDKLESELSSIESKLSKLE